MTSTQTRRARTGVDGPSAIAAIATYSPCLVFLGFLAFFAPATLTVGLAFSTAVTVWASLSSAGTER